MTRKHHSSPAKKNVSKKKNAVTRRQPRRKVKTNWLFACECALSLALMLALAAGGATFIRHGRSRQTQVLGVSTKLDIDRIVSLLNLERAKVGVGPVTLEEKLNQAATAKAEHMFSDSYWAHVSPDGTQPWQFIQDTGYGYQSAGENLARDFADEQSLVAAWMASPTHRDNIINGNFSEVGLAVLDGQIAGEPVLLVVNFFAQPSSWWPTGRQTAVYNQQEDSLVLAGEVMPTGQLLTGHKQLWSWTEIFFGIIIAVGVCLVLVKLKQKPGRKKKALWR